MADYTKPLIISSRISYAIPDNKKSIESVRLSFVISQFGADSISVLKLGEKSNFNPFPLPSPAIGHSRCRGNWQKR